MNRFPIHFAAILMMSLLVTACSDDDDPVQPEAPTVHEGASASIGQGEVRVWEKEAPDGSLLSVGVTFTEDALVDLPGQMKMVSLPLPQSVSTSPFTKIGFDWNPHGHEPVLYELPHFDVHFYVVSDQELAAVQPGPDTTPVEPQYVPPDYISTVDAVPFMGTHWVDTTSAEFHGSMFDETFIYGYYDGELYFLEPMITKAYFEAGPDEVIDIKQPAAFQFTGRAFPMQYRISHDAEAGEYTVELISMQVR